MLNDAKDEIAAVYRSFVDEIYSYCARRVYRRDIAEDATAAVFLRLVRRYPELSGKTRPELRNWLYGTASNVARLLLKDRRRQDAIEAELASQPPAEAKPAHERLDWAKMYRAIGRLPRDWQDIVVMRFFQGLSTPEIAEALGMKDKTVRTYLLRAMKRLRRDLGSDFNERRDKT